MSFEYTPPKYAQLIAELERRIDSGEYPPGSPLPSEHQLMAEFAMARPTVVKALGVLRDQGWITDDRAVGLAFKFAGEILSREEIDGILAEAGGPRKVKEDEQGNGDNNDNG